MPSVLFVCTANQCRSPMAEAIFKKMLADKRKTGWRVASAGTWARDGAPAAGYAQKTMSARGLDIRDHGSINITAQVLLPYQLILTMENGHKEALQAEFPKLAGRIYLLSEMIGKVYEIPDPIGGPLEAYQRTADQITAILEQGFDRIALLAGER